MTIDQLEALIKRSFEGSDFPARVLLANGDWMNGTLDIIDRNAGLVMLDKPTSTGYASSNPAYFGVSELVAVQPLGKIRNHKAPVTAA